jgi:hypothetical protein
MGRAGPSHGRQGDGERYDTRLRHGGTHGLAQSLTLFAAGLQRTGVRPAPALSTPAAAARAHQPERKLVAGHGGGLETETAETPALLYISSEQACSTRATWRQRSGSGRPAHSREIECASESECWPEADLTPNCELGRIEQLT